MVLNLTFKHLKSANLFINSDNKSNSKMNASSQYEDKCGLECVILHAHDYIYHPFRGFNLWNIHLLVFPEV